MIEFEFVRFDGEVGLNRNKIRGVAITIVISQTERDLLWKIKRKLKKSIYYLIFNIRRGDVHLFICHLDDIHIVRRKKTLLTADLEGTILNQNEYKIMERLLGLWEGILWETVHGIILQGTNPEDAKSLGYTYLVLNEKN
ncbi:MAG: hypothetical protein FHOMOCKG_00027 [Methanophagales virus GBV302]|uniref:Uncharacterized protein n=1 Tax=Methanophagales virus GBV302 TaxID=2999281 RepID=A0A9E8VD25_9CAUD|nr:MAG: hypothetical protein QIT37_gp027 [Methanophagales virus GBV302]WAE39555.1 MAG: hypothetical protein FHOMOCKG_00027 [Methanophagales virus GBV302]